MKTILRGKPLEVRFWASVERRGENECWLFRGHIDGDGYGRIFQAGGVMFLAHRLAWSLINGREWPRGAVALHSCDVRACCNPAHVRPGTIADNTADMVAKRRHVFGERSPRAKLTEERAREIIRRRLAGERATALAREFGVSDSLVCGIASGRKWAHLRSEVAP